MANLLPLVKPLANRSVTGRVAVPLNAINGSEARLQRASGSDRVLDHVFKCFQRARRVSNDLER